ncbi:MAG: Coenzyme F420 hydrogenase subunit beta [Promethearchaeota archaeon]|nr:MAG: Coenzyme F420 hydrogenase subunit beta [Candidatus Lokiarchaeota archaeon]
MSIEGKVSWELIKNLKDCLDSYKIRAFLDAKKEIVEQGIYTEEDYKKILFTMLEREKAKFSLLSFLDEKSINKIEDLQRFSEKESLNFKETLSLLDLLKNEGYVDVKEEHETLENEDDSKKNIFKDFSINVLTQDPESVKPIYEPVKVIFDAEICSGCGLCAGICPMDCIEIDNGFGKIDEDKCIRCGLCYHVCPRSFLPIRVLNMYQDSEKEIKDYSNVGPYIEAFCARTKDEDIKRVSQDGGITSTILSFLLEEKLIDSAVGATMSNNDPWKPKAMIIKNKEDVLSCAGTKYVNNPNLKLLNHFNNSEMKTAVVGVPCMMQALLKSKIYDTGFPSLNNVKYRIGIFCMESFPYEQGFIKICKRLGVSVDQVKKTDINKGKFFIFTEDGKELTVPIKEISNLAREDCEVCFDLTSESADISIGSIGAPSGWNAILIRTKKGKELYENLISKDLIESKKLEDVKPGLPLLVKIAGFKRKGSEKHISKKIDQSERYPQY